MRRAMELTMIAAALCVAVPIWFTSGRELAEISESMLQIEDGQEQLLMTEKPTKQEDSESRKITVLSPEGSPKEMELEEYLVGVLLGEMPAEFPEEAQKAQAAEQTRGMVLTYGGSS